VLAQLTKGLVERAMSAELTEHLDYEPHQIPSAPSALAMLGLRSLGWFHSSLYRFVAGPFRAVA
jgi:NADH/NAD ratio-sensing transcriptional regulator Rex